MPCTPLALGRLLLLPAVAAAGFPLHLNYAPVGGAIEIENSGRYGNRPLYGAGNGMLVLAGDRPLVKAAGGGHELGTLMVALSRGGRCGGWAQLDPAATTTHSYRPGTSSWNVTSPVAPGLALHMQAAPTDGGLGMAVRVAVFGAPQPGDELLWLFGGIGRGFDPSKSDPAVGSGDGPHRLIDDRGNLGMLATGFDVGAALGNKAAINGSSGFTITGTGVSVRGVTSSAAAARVISLAGRGNDSWENASALLHGGLGPPPPPPPPPAPPPVPASLLEEGLALRLRAADLVTAGLKPGDRVASWAGGAGAQTKLTQNDAAKQPMLQMLTDFANGAPAPAVAFAGANASALTGALELGPEQTFVAVARTSSYKESTGCCNALCCAYRPTDAPSTKGVSVKTAGDSVHLILDYDGQNNAGSTPIGNSDLVLSTRYGQGTAGGLARAAGCDQVTIKSLPTETQESTQAITLGSRESDPQHLAGRYFTGAILELLVYNRSLSDAELQGVEAFLASEHKLLATSFKCAAASSVADMVGAAEDLTKERELFFSFEAKPTAERMAETPEQTFRAAMQRATAIERRVQVVTPDPHVNAGIPMAGAAVDGLWRDSAQTFVHGAMAWDLPLVGWRSEYGGTIFGQVDRVAMEGARMVKSQVQPDDPNRNGTDNIKFTRCNADPARLLTEEAQESRFYGVGRVMPPGSVGNQGM